MGSESGYMAMTEDTKDWEAMYHQVVAENETLREHNVSYDKDSLTDYLNWTGMNVLLQNKYFIWGMIVGAVILLLFVIVYGD